MATAFALDAEPLDSRFGRDHATRRVALARDHEASPPCSAVFELGQFSRPGTDATWQHVGDRLPARSRVLWL
jgi:hypothetical protein